MRVSLLGPFEVESGDRRIIVGAAKERSLLASLALDAGHAVAVDALIQALWGEDPPPAARKTLQTYVWNLRQTFGPDTILTEPLGYALRIEPTEVDVGRFRVLVDQGDAAMAAGEAVRAADVLGRAVGLWRGEPFGGVAEHTGLISERARLTEEYLSALESNLGANLAIGRHAQLVSEIEGLIGQHPYRERLWGHLMVALYRSGRQAEALGTYQRARRMLLEELGLEPGGELRRIEEAILRHDDVLAAPEAANLSTSVSAGTPGPARRSPVRYARSRDGVSVAYQVAGDGPVDILAIPGFVSHLDIWWNAPTDGLVHRLASLGRLISFDKRGMGLSDRPDAVNAMRWVDDALAVLDAAGSTSSVVLGVSAGTPTAIRLAALHPDRVQGLVVFGGGARTIAGPGYEIGHDRATLESFAANLEKRWGSGVAISTYAPSRADDPHVRDYWARYQQLSASPAAAMRSFWAAVESDVSDLLPSIAAPTMVVHPERDIVAPVAWGRFLAEQIPDAEFVGLDSDVDLICVSDVIPELAQHIAEFIERIAP